MFGTSAIWTISHVNHNGKSLSIRNLNPLSELERIWFSWTISSNWKNDYPSINNTSVLPPNLGVISSFFNKEVVSAYLLICGDMYWRTTFSFLDFITDNVMLDFKYTSVWNTGLLWRLYVVLINKVYHCWKIGTYPCGTSSVIMRSDLLSNHLDIISFVIENLHHASVVHWRFSTKLSSSICIQGSLSGMPQSLEVALHTLFIQFLWRTFFAFIWCRTPTHRWYNDSCRGMSGLSKRVIIIVFSLHLGEDLVLDLAMLAYIHCSSPQLSVDCS